MPNKTAILPIPVPAPDAGAKNNGHIPFILKILRTKLILLTCILPGKQ